MNDSTDIFLTPAQLSHEGRQRQAQMLGELTDQMRRVHRTRRIRRQAGASMLLLAFVGGVSWFGQPSSSPPGEHLPAPRAAELNPPRAQSTNVIEYVQTDVRIVERLATEAVPRVIWLDDQRLLAALNEIGRPTGLIRLDGSLQLTSNVVDAQVPTIKGM